MTRDELRDLIIEGEVLIKQLKKVWRFTKDEIFEEQTANVHLPCDSCEKE